MKKIISFILLFGYLAFFTPVYSQNELHCRFKVMAAKEKKCFLTKKISISKIKNLKMPEISNKKLILLSEEKNTVSKNHELFSLEFSWQEDNLKIQINPNLPDASETTMANISLTTLLQSGEYDETYIYKLFIPIEVKTRKGLNIYVHGLEIGPCYSKN